MVARWGFNEGPEDLPDVSSYFRSNLLTQHLWLCIKANGFSSETVDAVMRDFYVDDFLKSFETTSQAEEITKELQELLAKGGFQLTKVKT